MTKEGSSHHDRYDEESAPLKQPTEQTAPHYYGTFQGNPSYPQPTHPGYRQSAHPEQQDRGVTVEGYPMLEGAPQQEEGRLPCCGIGVGWFLFILGWFLGSVPWWVAVILLVCTRHDHRERIGLVCCTIAAILSLIAIVVGSTSATS